MDSCTNQVHVQTRDRLFSDNCTDCGAIPTYADDSTMVITTSTRFKAQEKLSKNMYKMKEYLNSYSLSMNMGKTEIVQCMVRQKRTWVEGAPPNYSDQTRWHPETNNCQSILQTTRYKLEPGCDMETPPGAG